jgi:outer membrane receptor protein involved in Fe transport
MRNRKMLQRLLQMKTSIRLRCFRQMALLTTILMLCNVMPIQAKNITGKFQEEQLSTRLKKIGELGGADILFDLKEVGAIHVSALNAKGLTVEKALEYSLSGTSFTWKKTAETSYAVMKKQANQQSQPIQGKGVVSGKITDENGEGLPGVNIRLVGTQAGTITDIEGRYKLTMHVGTYQMEISMISYQKQKITDIVVKPGANTALNLAIKPANNQLSDVVVTASYRKASVAGLYLQQKNAASVSDGISSEQIARTPDKNIGESLKRISGVSTVDQKFVLVRGIGERYNSAMLDGVALPSTEAQSRNFSFDLIPSNMVDNVVVSKTVTPDMNASFGGGLIQINTKDIPNENFVSLSVGASYNDQTTGKDFLSHKRGKYDYFGFDDGRRDYPKGLVNTDRLYEPVKSMPIEDYTKMRDDQSKRFTNDNFTVYKYKAAPSQNYQFTIGRLIALDTNNNNKFGFTGSLSYRNTQNINQIGDQRRKGWNIAGNNTGASYNFNTTWGGLLNAGLQLGKNHFSLRNTYTHMYDNTLIRTTGYENDNGNDFILINTPNRIEEAGDPTFTNLLQNKLSGQHQLGKVKIEWDLARTGVNREEKDAIIANKNAVELGGTYQYFYSPGSSTEPRIDGMSRQYYHNRENHYSWNLSATVPIEIAGIRNMVKAGYFGNHKKADFNWQIAAFTADYSNRPDSIRYLPIGEMLKPEYIGENGYFYSVTPFWVDAFEGKSRNHAGYVMFDSHLLENLRLVWGLRGEYYKYTEIKNAANDKMQVFKAKPDPRWQWLPSANLTYSPVQSLNFRAAFSSTVVRPELMDNSQAWKYNAYLGGMFGNEGLYSTRIDSYDLKAEWFPGLGEVISVGGFYKKFDKPAELIINEASGNTVYYLKSADWAKVYGVEFELRKNFGFIADNNLLNNLAVYGNLTLQKSSVRATHNETNPADPTEPNIEVSSKQKRPMYGQTPYLINGGIQYTGDHLGFNIMYNKSGYKTYLVGEKLNRIEYERPREQLDAQISYKLLKKRLEIKLNAGNLLNRASVFYINSGSYEANPDYVAGTGDSSDAERLKAGYTDKYEKGDQIMFSQKFGRTYSTTITWNF